MMINLSLKVHDLKPATRLLHRLGPSIHISVISVGGYLILISTSLLPLANSQNPLQTTIIVVINIDNYVTPPKLIKEKIIKKRKESNISIFSHFVSGFIVMDSVLCSVVDVWLNFMLPWTCMTMVGGFRSFL
jgi:hypothetical protein